MASKGSAGTIASSAWVPASTQPAAPAGQVGNELVIHQMQLGLEEEEPAARAPAPGLKRRAELGAERERTTGVSPRGTRARVKVAVHDLPDLVGGQLEQVFVRGGLPSRAGHDPV